MIEFNFWYGLLLIISAVIGAITGVFGQAIREWYMRPRLDFELRTSRGTANGVFFEIYLVLYNKGRSTSRSTRVHFKKAPKDDDVGYDPIHSKGYVMDPGDCLYFRIGRNTMESDNTTVILGADCSNKDSDEVIDVKKSYITIWGDHTTYAIDEFALEVKMLATDTIGKTETYHLSEKFLEQNLGLPKDGTEVISWLKGMDPLG